MGKAEKFEPKQYIEQLIGLQEFLYTMMIERKTYLSSYKESENEYKLLLRAIPLDYRRQVKDELDKALRSKHRLTVLNSEEYRDIRNLSKNILFPSVNNQSNRCRDEKAH